MTASQQTEQSQSSPSPLMAAGADIPPLAAAHGRNGVARPEPQDVAARAKRQIAAATQPLLVPAADVAQALESLLFVATEPAEIASLARALGVRVAAVEQAASELGERLRGHGLRLQRAGSRLQLVTAPEWSRYVERFLGIDAEQPLSTAALETLAIVAYRQPVTRAAIESIRGVSSERALATLRARGLIDEVGRAEGVGRPLLYGTTMQFLEYFGLENVGDLPPLPAEEEA